MQLLSLYTLCKVYCAELQSAQCQCSTQYSLCSEYSMRCCAVLCTECAVQVCVIVCNWVFSCMQLSTIQCASECNSVCPVQWWFEHTAQHSAVLEHTCQLVSKPPAGSPATSIFLLDSCYCDWDFFAWFVLLLDSCYCDEDMTVSVVRSIWKGGLPVSDQEAARPHLFEAAAATQLNQQQCSSNAMQYSSINTYYSSSSSCCSSRREPFKWACVLDTSYREDGNIIQTCQSSGTRSRNVRSWTCWKVKLSEQFMQELQQWPVRWGADSSSSMPETKRLIRKGFKNKLAKLGYAISISNLKLSMTHWPTHWLTERGRC